MPDLNTFAGPGSISTVTPAGPGPGGPSDLETFYRELLKRQSQTALAAPPRQQFAPPVARYQPQAAPEYVPPPLQADRAMADARRQDEKSKMAYQRRLREIDLSPPTKYIEGRPGILGGYIQDTTALPVSMRPGNAAIGYGPQDEARSRGRLADEQAFNAQLDTDRARVARPGVR